MKGAAIAIGRAVARRWLLWIAVTVGFVVLYQAVLMAALVVRFENVPNYVTFYNYPANVYAIFANTPSLEDAIAIVKDEWLIEIGYMNYDYGKGISEWSLTVLPTKLAILLAVGALVAACVVLLLSDGTVACAANSKGAVVAAVGGGASLVGLASATMSWVVCCATPTWVVGLTMLGMSTSLAFWLEPFGLLVNLAGFAVLIAALFFLARRRAAGADDAGPLYGHATNTA